MPIGDAVGSPGAATIQYRYSIGGHYLMGTKQPTRVQIGRRKDAGGTSYGRRAYEWQVYDGVGRLIQRQVDFDRSIQVIRAQDVNDMRQKLINYGQTISFAAVTARVDPVRAGQFTEMRDKIQNLWNGTPAPLGSLGPLPAWSSNVTPTTGTTPVFGSDLVDLRAWLQFYESARAWAITDWANAAGTMIVVNRAYDNRGLLSKESMPHLLTLDTPGWFDSGDWGSTTNPATTYTYDPLQRPARRTNPDGTFVDWTYAGWDTDERDENAHKRTFSNDAVGRLLTVKEYTGTNPWTLDATTTYAYNLLDQLTGVADAVGNNTSISYDKLGRKTAMTDPDLGAWSYGYGAKAFADVLSQTDAKTQVLDFVYDVLHRLTQRKQGANVLQEFVYDEVTGGFAGYSGRGRRTTMKYGASLANTMKYFYDSRGRVGRAEHTLGGTTYVRQTAYDDLDRVLSITHPNNEVVAYRYGDHGAPVRLTSSRWGVIVESAAYNALLKPTSVALGNGLSAAYQYWGVEYRPVANPNGHFGLVRSVVAGALQNLTYDYDSRGNVSQLVDTRVGETINFAYDHLDRLTSASSGLFSESYGYSKIGTFTSKGGVAYTYPNAGQPRPHTPLTVGGNSYTYDSNGNLTNAEGRTYTYDVLNRLTGLSGDVTKSFTYDGDGVLRTNVAGGVTTRVVSGDYRVNASTGEAFVLYGFMGRQVAWGNNTSLKYLLADHLTSSHAEVSTGQSELGQRRAFPFGSDRAVSGASDITAEERYTGQRRLDAGNGNTKRELYYYRARWYLPGVGLFSQPDVSGIQRRSPQSLNRYAYVLNNPVRYIDPLGLQSEDDSEPSQSIQEVLSAEQPNWFDESWQWEFQAANGHPPEATDYLDRYNGMMVASGMVETTDTGVSALAAPTMPSEPLIDIPLPPPVPVPAPTPVPSPTPAVAAVEEPSDEDNRAAEIIVGTTMVGVGAGTIALHLYAMNLVRQAGPHAFTVAPMIPLLLVTAPIEPIVMLGIGIIGGGVLIRFGFDVIGGNY